MEDQDLQKKLEAYQELAKQNPNIDVGALMAGALEHQQESNLPTKKKITAYFVSIAFPPFGLIYAIRFYFSGATDGKKAALYCVLLTALTIVVTMMIFNAILSAGGSSVQQLQQINPSDIQSLIQ